MCITVEYDLPNNAVHHEVTNKTGHFNLNVSLSRCKLQAAQFANATAVSRWPKARASVCMDITNVNMILIKTTLSFYWQWKRNTSIVTEMTAINKKEINLTDSTLR
jgi:hypothetical protein